MKNLSSFKNQTSTIPSRKKIVRNRCKCSVCLTVIESKHRHDFVQCACGRIFTDGGLEYIHRGFTHPNDLIDLTEYKDNP